MQGAVHGVLLSWPVLKIACTRPPSIQSSLKRRMRHLAVAEPSFDGGYCLVDHRLTAQPTMHRLCRVKPSGLEQLVGRRTASAPAEVLTSAFARVDAALNFGGDLFEKG